jgi:hypothetical protein
MSRIFVANAWNFWAGNRAMIPLRLKLQKPLQVVEISNT